MTIMSEQLRRSHMWVQWIIAICIAKEVDCGRLMIVRKMRTKSTESFVGGRWELECSHRLVLYPYPGQAHPVGKKSRGGSIPQVTTNLFFRF